MKEICKNCDHCIESKQGTKCFNPKSEMFNEKIELKNTCDYIEFNYYINPKDDEKGLFNEIS